MDSLQLSLPVTLFVADVNDNAPMFENAQCNASVQERVAIEEEELRVASIDSQSSTSDTILKMPHYAKETSLVDSTNGLILTSLLSRRNREFPALASDTFECCDLKETH